MNARKAIFYQWEQLEKSSCIDNFRIIAEGKEKFREGWYFADSDAYKWLDAAARIYATHPSPRLKALMDEFINLIAQTQDESGYIFTYNQIHFPGVRWVNLQNEHELYCHGHLIEAAVSHYEATGESTLLTVAQKAANLLVRDLSGAGPEFTPGHQEIEIALIKLARITGNGQYLDLAKQFIEQRGKIKHYTAHILRENANVAQRGAQRDAAREKYIQTHPEHNTFKLSESNTARRPPFIIPRYKLNFWSGKKLQQHKPVRKQTVPVGHSVRFTYLETAIAMLHRERGDDTLLPALEAAWEQMVTRRMYVTGGIGSLPAIEGFGRDYELDPEYAYAETCAALGCMFWNWEMGLIFQEPKYADLFEWQLYNAASVGIGLDGTSYLYNNPLASRGGITRQGWFTVPCCPSNISRTWAYLGKYTYSHDKDELWIHQYVSSTVEVKLSVPVRLRVESGLPWDGRVTIRLEPESTADFSLHLRIPSWAKAYTLKINGEQTVSPQMTGSPSPPTASGYSPNLARTIQLTRTWSPGDTLSLEFSMEINILRPSPKVKSVRGKVAISRGPLVYCLESIDNPNLDIFALQADPASLHAEYSSELFDGIWVIRGTTLDQQPITAIPYYLWANRGASQMSVMVKIPHP